MIHLHNFITLTKNRGSLLSWLPLFFIKSDKAPVSQLFGFEQATKSDYAYLPDCFKRQRIFAIEACDFLDFVKFT